MQKIHKKLCIIIYYYNVIYTNLFKASIYQLYTQTLRTTHSTCLN